jgi:hypothetical protein
MAIGPAVLKRPLEPAELDTVEPRQRRYAPRPHAGALIRGRALIFWDASLAGTRYRRKLDAIDTDQITPARDCVSDESSSASMNDGRPAPSAT